MNQYIDQLGRTVNIPAVPKKIISLVPSQTELLYDLGIDDSVVGITKFCIHPNQWYRNKKRVGGTKNVNLNLVDEILPDLIIANKEENSREDIEHLAKKYPVWISDIYNLQDALNMIISLGDITHTPNKANAIIKSITDGFNLLKSNLKGINKKVVYLIWKDPIISVGNNTFIDDMLNQSNLQNLMNTKARYPELSEEELIELSPDILMLSSEPFPFKEKHVSHFQKLLPNSHVIIVDGEMYSWYGSRLMQSPEYFTQLSDTINSSAIEDNV